MQSVRRELQITDPPVEVGQPSCREAGRCGACQIDVRLPRGAGRGVAVGEESKVVFRRPGQMLFAAGCPGSGGKPPGFRRVCCLRNINLCAARDAADPGDHLAVRSQRHLTKVMGLFQLGNNLGNARIGRRSRLPAQCGSTTNNGGCKQEQGSQAAFGHVAGMLAQPLFCNTGAIASTVLRRLALVTGEGTQVPRLRSG